MAGHCEYLCTNVEQSGLWSMNRAQVSPNPLATAHCSYGFASTLLLPALRPWRPSATSWRQLLLPALLPRSRLLQPRLLLPLLLRQRPPLRLPRKPWWSASR